MSQDIASHSPFRIVQTEPFTLLKFSEYVDTEFEEGFDRKLTELLSEHDRVVCDLSETIDVVTRWLKLFHRLSNMAKNQGKIFAISGMNSFIQKKADARAIQDKLTFLQDPSEVLGL